MPRPCPRCSRPVPDSKKACLFCGTVAPPVSASLQEAGGGKQAQGPPSCSEPRLLDSVDAVTALIAAAYAAQQRGDMDGVARMMSRIFRELSPNDRKHAIRFMTDAWLRELKGQLGAAELSKAEEMCQQGIAAAADGRFIDASGCFAQARIAVGVKRRVNPAVDWLALGAMQAGKGAIDDEKREAQIRELIDKASGLLVTGGKSGEAVDLLRKALALLPDPPVTERDRIRVERIRKAIDEQSRTGSAPVDPNEPAFTLPAAGTMSHDGWNVLGERLAELHPKGALICFERAIAGDPTIARYWRNKATTLLKLEAPLTSVAEAYEKAVSRAPEDVAAWIGLAAALQQGGGYEAAVAAWNAVLRLQPGATAAAAHREFCVRAAALMLEGSKWDAPAWVAKGITYVDAQEWVLADACFEKASNLAPHHIGALCGKGVALYKWAVQTKATNAAAAAARFALAADSLQEALQLDSTNEAARAVLRLCEAELGPPH